MATKLKNFSRAWYLKAIAYVFIAVTAAGTLLYVGNRGDYTFLRNLNGVSYKESSEVHGYFMDWGRAVDLVMTTNLEELDINNKEYWNFDKPEEVNAAKNKNTLENEEVDTEVYITIPIENEMIAESVRLEMQNFYNVWWNEGGQYKLTVHNDALGNLYYRTDYSERSNKESDLSYTHFLKEHPQIQKQVLAGVLHRMKCNYEEAMEQLLYATEELGLVYDISDKDNEKLKEKYTDFPLYVRMEKGCITNSSVPSLIGCSVYSSGRYLEKNTVCYLGMCAEYYNEQNQEWAMKLRLANTVMPIVIISASLIAVCFLYLISVTGRRPENEKVWPAKIDAVYSEVQWTIGSCLGVAISGLLATVVFADQVMALFYYRAIVVLIVIMGMLLMELMLSQIRLLKAKRWLDSFLSIRLLKKGIRVIKRAFNIAGCTWKRGKLSMRAMVLAIVLPILCGTWIGIPFVIIFLIYMIYRYVDDFLAICEGAEKIREGQLNYQIPIKHKGGELEKLAEDINELSQGLENAVSSELRSERLKAELISNVSHDLKTPLTSIVTYVDLLKQEEIENETAKDYIEVIDRKAKRLTVLTNDLFEAAKASSGAMPVNIETVDLNALVRQALGEFDEKLEQAELEVRLLLPQQPSYVKADGRLTWRVIDNLLNNVVKYAQKGSRVYIEVKEQENGFGFVMKNISAYELNIPSEELMERFKRGDESRNSEGSGLGLNIANSLIDLQHGKFSIFIDGDLFKAEFELPKSL